MYEAPLEHSRSELPGFLFLEKSSLELYINKEVDHSNVFALHCRFMTLKRPRDASGVLSNPYKG